MNKAELVSALAEKNGGNRKAAEEYLNVFLEVVAETLAKREKVKLVNFGTFEVVRRAARKGHNIHTNEIFDIPAKDEPVFKAGKELKETINSK